MDAGARQPIGRGVHSKSLEKFGPVAEVSNRWGGYLKSIGQELPQAIDILMQTEQGLRHGTPQQKRAMISKLMHDYGVQFEAPAEGAVELDPQVAQLTQTVQQMQAGQAQAAQQEQQRSEAQMRAAVQTFAEAKTEAGTLAHPYFAEVEDDMARLAQAGLVAGAKPELDDLYGKAIWANPDVREKLLAAQQREAAAKRDTDERGRIQKAKAANGSISGAGGGSGTEQPKGLRDQIEAAYDKHAA